MSDAQTVYVVDDDEAVRESLRWILEGEGMSVETFENASEVLERFDSLDGQVSGMLVADLRLPDFSGQELLEQLDAREINLPVLMITGHGDVTAAAKAFRSGVIDFLEKPYPERKLLARVREGLDLDRTRTQDRTLNHKIHSKYDNLTKREREVMQRVIQGRLNKQIATELGLSHKTIEVHRKNVMQKMKAGSLAELVRMSVLGKVPRDNDHS